jgi:hypothetical protein
MSVQKAWSFAVFMFKKDADYKYFEREMKGGGICIYLKIFAERPNGVFTRIVGKLHQ